jgi:hypothetical protein
MYARYHQHHHHHHHHHHPKSPYQNVLASTFLQPNDISKDKKRYIDTVENL